MNTTEQIEQTQGIEKDLIRQQKILKGNGIINIDWLSVGIDIANMQEPHDFTFELKDYGTRQFKNIFVITYDNKEFATLCTTPHSTIIDKNFGLLKINNYFLYRDDCKYLIHNFLNQTQTKIKSFNRIDICCDFNEFAHNLTPTELINNFLSNTYKKKGQAKYKLIGEQQNEHIFEYLRFGSATSDISAYLYNKTKEFQDVKKKIYIEDIWKEKGFDINSNIWRLEFSIKGCALKIYETNNQEYHFRDINKIFDKTEQQKLFTSLVHKYFYFYKEIHNGKKIVKQKINLFWQNFEYMKIICDDKRQTTNRADKIFINKLEDTANELRQIKKNIDQETKEILKNTITLNNLQEWYINKHPNGLVINEIIKKEI